jgi:leucyl aminopeptidase
MQATRIVFATALLFMMTSAHAASAKSQPQSAKPAQSPAKVHAHQHGDIQDFFTKQELAEQRLIDRGDGKPQWMPLSQALEISAFVHEQGRCAGFFDLTDQKPVDPKPLVPVETFTLSLADRPMTQAAYLSQALSALESQRMFKTVSDLSAYRNRFYKSETGVQSANYIADQFRAIAKGRTDITVEMFQHSKWMQPSVMVTMKGTGAKANEIVVIGGHEDSINQMAFGMPGMNAPGADDNASGVATILEVFRVLVDTNFKPNRTLMFMTYAAEEVGLLGSQEIANKFKSDNKSVVGVVQFDMTGFPGAGDQIVFMTDFTSPELTQFSQKLLDTYVKAKWSTDKCGYACSDHASWTKAGYPSVMPFEATMSADNKEIHTPRDTIQKLSFDHVLRFAKLGLAFMAELAN